MDYFWVRRGYGINISQIFKPHGIYWYNYGVNWRAMVAWFVALAPLFPGMLHSMGVPISNKGILGFYSWNYVLVVVFSGLLYLALTTISPIPVGRDTEDLGKLYVVDGLDPVDTETHSLEGSDLHNEKMVESKGDATTAHTLV